MTLVYLPGLVWLLCIELYERTLCINYHKQTIGQFNINIAGEHCNRIKIIETENDKVDRKRCKTLLDSSLEQFANIDLYLLI